jgi:hypothetical protein
MRGVLAEIGYADALLARALPDGTLQLVDGHLRAEVSPEALVPVLVLDVDEQEALKLLATLDPLAAMAGADGDLLTRLVAEVETSNQAVRAMLDDVAAEHAPSAGDDVEESHAEPIVLATFQVVVECRDENEQRAVFERLSAEGFKCRVMAL